MTVRQRIKGKRKQIAGKRGKGRSIGSEYGTNIMSIYNNVTNMGSNPTPTTIYPTLAGYSVTANGDNAHQSVPPPPQINYKVTGKVPYPLLRCKMDIKVTFCLINQL